MVKNIIILCRSSSSIKVTWESQERKPGVESFLHSQSDVTYAKFKTF